MSKSLSYQGFCREGEEGEGRSGKTCYAPKYLHSCQQPSYLLWAPMEDPYYRQRSHMIDRDRFPRVGPLKSGDEQCNSSKECGFYLCHDAGDDGGWYSFERRERGEELKNKSSEYIKVVDTGRRSTGAVSSGSTIMEVPWSDEELEAEARRLKQNDIDLALTIGRSPTNYVFPDYF